MPILLFLLLVVLVATFGFWDTLAATLGAALLVVLVVVVGIAVLGLASYLFLRKGRRS